MTDKKDIKTIPYLDKYKEFQESMIDAMADHYPHYEDSWRDMSIGKLNDRLQLKISEFNLTFKPSKLISIANLAMLVYIRMKEQNTINPEDVIV